MFNSLHKIWVIKLKSASWTSSHGQFVILLFLSTFVVFIHSELTIEKLGRPFLMGYVSQSDKIFMGGGWVTCVLDSGAMTMRSVYGFR